jgi:histidyl-tRNA synthetase
LDLWLDVAARERPDAAAVNGVSYGELHARAAACADALAARGVSAGDRVATTLGGLDFAVLLHALPRLGAVLVPLNTRLTEGRAYIEAGMHKDPQPVKLWYVGPFFRQERPQKGRYRQFTQIGAEAIGSEDPSLDAEVILLLHEYLERIGAGGVRLKLSSLGNPDTRREYLDDLRSYLRANSDRVSEEVRSRIDLNPLRAFDASDDSTKEVMRGAPLLLDALAHDDAEHFARVREFLDDAGVPYDIDPTLVRGLDYYTRTVFEFESAALGAQSGVGGGGRYDLLIEQLGGQPTPGVGWAAGIERMVLASREETDASRVDVFVAIDGGDPRVAFRLVSQLRGKGLRARMEQAGRSLKGQLKQAGRLGAASVAIVGPEAIRVRAGGSELEVADVDAAVAAVEAGEEPTA